jgi:glycosyltransferase involved in cell wall biosynthesis
MKVVLINETHSPLMGYLGTSLSKYLARLGLEVHVIATDLPAYHNFPEHASGSAPKFLSEQAWPSGTVRNVDGYTVHILPHARHFGHVYMRGLRSKLNGIDPDVVYSILAIGWIPLQAAAISLFSRYKLFTGSHTTASMFPLAREASPSFSRLLKAYLTRWLPGRVVSLFSEVCYCPTADCGEVAQRFFGVQEKKIKIVYLGIDADVFFPVTAMRGRSSREAIRRELGFSDEDIVCIYTGKMAESKNPLLLATAIEMLRAEGRKFRGLFIGDGKQRETIAAHASCVVLEFMPFVELGDYYRAADIAVWPTTESTSMLDAAACGLPLIVSDRIYQDHVSGNGLKYSLNDLKSLCEALRSLESAGVRQTLGHAGAEKMYARFNWARAAKIRHEDFLSALGRIDGT